MSRFCTALLLLAWGCGDETGPAAPLLVLERDSIDLGECLAKTRQKVAVALYNHGSAPLELEKLGTSCTCSGASVSSDRIESGGAARLWIGVTPEDPGPGSAFVKVHSNCSISPVHVVQVQWTCVEAVEVVPPHISFGDIRPGQETARDVAVLCRKAFLPEGAPCRPVGVEPEDPRCRFVGTLPYDITPDVARTVGRLLVTADDTTGDASARVTFKIDGAGQRDLVVRIDWRNVHAVETIPQRLSLGEFVPGSEREPSGTVLVRSNEGELVLGDIVAEHPWVHVEATRLSASLTRLTVTRTGELADGIHTSRLTIPVTSPVVEAVEVPVSLIVSSPKE